MAGAGENKGASSSWCLGPDLSWPSWSPGDQHWVGPSGVWEPEGQCQAPEGLSFLLRTHRGRPPRRWVGEWGSLRLGALGARPGKTAVAPGAGNVLRLLCWTALTVVQHGSEPNRVDAKM